MSIMKNGRTYTERHRGSQSDTEESSEWSSPEKSEQVTFATSCANASVPKVFGIDTVFYI